jgi:hypothetical protein
MEKEERAFDGAKRVLSRARGAVPVPPAAAAPRPKEITKEGLSEYFLYTIEGTETIPTGWSKRLMSFDIEDVPVVNLYKFEQERYGNSVVRFLSFKNDTEHELGETPIPGGMLKVYRGVGNAGHLSYANVVVEPKLVDFESDNYTFDRRGDVSGWDEIRTFNTEVRNTRDIAVKVEIKRNFNTPYWDLAKSGDSDQFAKEDVDTVKFTLVLEPRSAKQFQYIVRTYHGQRQQNWRAASQLR